MLVSRCTRSLRQIRGLAIPLMVKLRARLGRDAASAMYLNMLEDNLKSLTASMSGELTRAFEALTPGRQREYNLHVSDAKQASTRAARVEKQVPRILEGKGLRDR